MINLHESMGPGRDLRLCCLCGTKSDFLAICPNLVNIQPSLTFIAYASSEGSGEPA